MVLGLRLGAMGVMETLGTFYISPPNPKLRKTWQAAADGQVFFFAY